MKQLILACSVALGLVAASSTYAHSPLKRSVPEDGAVVAAAAVPKQLELQFAHELRLTSVKLVGPGGAAALKTGREATVTHQLPLPRLASGEYRAEWRGMATDGHVMTGTVKFSIAGR